MTNSSNDSSETLPSPEAGVSLCVKCKTNPRDRKGSSYCKACRNEMAAVYRAHTRPRPTTEERICVLEGCDQTFTWRSNYPKQECCSKAHYMQKRWRDEHPIPVNPLPEDMRRCPGCGLVKHQVEFSPSIWNRGRGGRCRSCMGEYDRRWSTENRDKMSAATRRSRSARKLREYQAPSDNLDELIEAQGGLCLCCGKPPVASARNVVGFVIDHDHETGLYRGLLCGNCNTRLHDGADLHWFLQAVAYLNLDRTP